MSVISVWHRYILEIFNLISVLGNTLFKLTPPYIIYLRQGVTIMLTVSFFCENFVGFIYKMFRDYESMLWKLQPQWQLIVIYSYILISRKTDLLQVWLAFSSVTVQCINPGCVPSWLFYLIWADRKHCCLMNKIIGMLLLFTVYSTNYA